MGFSCFSISIVRHLLCRATVLFVQICIVLCIRCLPVVTDLTSVDNPCNVVMHLFDYYAADSLVASSDRCLSVCRVVYSGQTFQDRPIGCIEVE